MSKRLILILALAFVVGLTCAAYAEVQNVKVGGDILLRGVARNNFDLKNSTTVGDKEDDQASFLTSNVRVRIDADLTDNVSTTVRLLNERLWGVEKETGKETSTAIDLDLAYVTLKEFLYSPLTLTLGRQELRFGNALIVGDPDTNRDVSTGSAFNTVTGTGSTGIAKDLSSRKAFDAVKAILNYDPLVVDLVYAKINESSVNRNDDVDLYGVNAVYALDKNTSLNPYLFVKTTGSFADGTKGDKIYVPGILVSSSAIKDLKLSLEGALQLGTRSNTNVETKRRAYAIQAEANYALPRAKKYSPVVGAGYTYLSGDKRPDVKKYTAWDPMYEDQTLNSIPNLLFDHSNMQVINLKGSLKPIEDLTLLANYGNYRLAQKVSTGSTLSGGYSTWYMTSKKALGNALDLSAIYDYTEDVQLGLTFGLFAPGKAFDKTTNNGRRSANQLIGSMKVTF